MPGWGLRQILMNMAGGTIYQFGPFHFEPAERRLHRDGIPVSLQPKVFDTLQLLVERAGHAVKKDDLMARVWPDATVTESSLAQNVLTLRKLIGSDAIETVPKFGYRLTVPVRAIRGGERVTSPSTLSDGDLVGFGSVTMTFHERPTLASTETQPSAGHPG